MRRSKRLKALQKKLSNLRKKADSLSSERMDADGNINIDVCTELNLTLTNISLTKKKIGFSQEGGSYLGKALGDATPRVSAFD